MKRLTSFVVSVVIASACQSGNLWLTPDSDVAPDADIQSEVEAGTDADDPNDAGGDSDSPRSDTDVDEGTPLPVCDEVGGSGFTISVDPPSPWESGSARVSVRSDEGVANVVIAVVGTGAAPTPEWIGVEGNGPWTWSWSLSPLRSGDFCVTFSGDPNGTVYQRARLHVATEPPPVAPFKVIESHQWTCEEMYTFAINMDTYVIDETGDPMPGVRILVEHEPCEIAEDHPPPTEVTTDENGFVRWENYNPHCFFHERVADTPSDTAIEIWTGIWEEQEGCNFCSTYAVNVYGHWSYTIVFQRTPGATEVCQVQNDQAGQSRCPPLPHWEDPVGPECSPLP